MKRLFLMIAAAAALTLSGCAKEKIVPTPADGSSIAYLSIEVDARRTTRASTEAPGKDESELNELYLITFDSEGDIVGVPGGTYHSYVDVSGKTPAEAQNPDPVKVSTAAKNLVIVANPGDKLKAAITSLGSGSNFSSFNAAIAGVQTGEITADPRGFTMITAGDDKNPVGGKVLYPYVSIGDYIQTGTGATEAEAEADAIAKAKARRLPVKLERLAAKLVVKAASPISAPESAEVVLVEWAPDVLNTTFYPFAEKTLMDVGHTGTDYAKNFYTRDPNFVSDPLTGYAADLAYATVAADYAPVLPFGGTWKTPGDSTNPLRIAYVIENTMAAAEQRVGSATRIVMKANYYPSFPSGYTRGDDWFSWAGNNYPSLAALQLAYKDANATSALKDACDRFLKRVKTVNRAIATDDFTLLTQDQLDDITNGGQVVKDGRDPVVKWYQKGLCYYSYEVRHDNAATGGMTFGKYGVVRNNWYDLTLNSVKGPGTPWYPEPENPGPGDPDPKDPIDTATGYVGVVITVNQWVMWSTPMEDVD